MPPAAAPDAPPPPAAAPGAARPDDAPLGDAGAGGAAPGRQPVPAQRVPPGRAGVGVRASRLRPVLAILGGVLALLCLGGLALAYVVYDEATAPDRSAPDVVVDNFLRAYLVDRDDAQADQYTCGDASGLEGIRALREDIQARERRYSVRIVVSWGSLRVESTPEGRAVTTEVRRSIADGSERAQDRWRFEVVDRDGWRVCGAERLS
jgi:hypothetical protein